MGGDEDVRKVVLMVGEACCLRNQPQHNAAYLAYYTYIVHTKATALSLQSILLAYNQSTLIQ